jgi:predicted transcriptional regulator
VSDTQSGGFGNLVDVSGQARRSPMEMVCDVLKVISSGPTKPTHILYKANMSWKVLSSYLDFLMLGGMIEKEDADGGKRSVYNLTIKGRRILRLYEGLRESLNGTITLETAEELGTMVEKATTVGNRGSVSPW